MFVFRIQLLWKSSLQRRYPPSQLYRLPSQPLRRLPSSPSVAGSYSISRRSQSIKSWSGCLAYSPSQCVLLDAVCDPGSGGSRSSCKSPVAVQSLRCPSVSPLSGECLHRAAHQLYPPLAATASVACVSSHCFGHSKLTFEATYRIQLLSLHLATFPPPATLAAGFGYGRLTILTRRASHPLDGEPYPGSRLLSAAPAGAFRPD